MSKRTNQTKLRSQKCINEGESKGLDYSGKEETLLTIEIVTVLIT